MDAFDVMTKAVITVDPDAPIREIAELLVRYGISAVPVVDEDDAVIGMVSEGDLLRFSAEDREARRDWWLDLLAQGESLSPEFLATLRAQSRTAKEIMSAPVVTVTEHTDIAEIGQLLTAHRIKRVPVLRDGRIAGIVSRADLIRALAAQQPKPPAHEGRLFNWVNHHENKPPLTAKEEPRKTLPVENALTASDLRSLVEAAISKKANEQEASRRASENGKEHLLKDAIEHHVTDERWREFLNQAQLAAARGETELLMLRFPAKLCNDGGRAINVPEPDWPATLRGEAAEAYLRWERELKPLGFHIIARILDFPGGFIGDIGLFLFWGGGA